MVEVIKRVEASKKRLLLECDCGSVIVFDESDIERADIKKRYWWYFSCPVCKQVYWDTNKYFLIMNHFKKITEQQLNELLR